MNRLSRLMNAPALAAVLLLAWTPTNAARRIGGSPYDGTWSVAIYTLRGDCGSVRVAAQIVGSRVVVGQHRGAQAITESGGHNRAASPSSKH